MTDRFELAKDIFLADNWKDRDAALQDWAAITLAQGDRTYAHAIADGLIALGYRKVRCDA